MNVVEITTLRAMNEAGFYNDVVVFSTLTFVDWVSGYH